MRPILLALFVATFAHSPAHAATFVVTSTADSGPGSLRSAILAANVEPGQHRIEFGDGFPSEGIILLASPLPTITAQALSIAGGELEPRIDGAGAHRPLQAGASNALLALEDLVIRNGFASNGGCIYTDGNGAGPLRLRRVTLSGCRAQASSLVFGGAIDWGRADSVLEVTDSVLFGNEAEATDPNGQAGGGAIATLGQLAVSGSIFQQNRAFNDSPTGGGGFGGAIYLSATSPSQSLIDFSQFVGNSTFPSTNFNRGGAIYATSHIELTVYGSWFRGNSAADGAAIDVRRTDGAGTDPALLTEASSYYNNAGLHSGAIRISNADFTALGSTFYNNSASAGAHVAFADTVRQLDFYANLLAPVFSGSPCSGTPDVDENAVIGYNLLADGSCNFAQADALPNAPLGSIDIDETPGLIPVVRFTGSAVIDSIDDPRFCINADARNSPRPLDGDGDGIARCDVGAFEHPGPSIFSSSFES